MKKDQIKQTILSYANMNEPFWKAYQAIYRGDPQKGIAILSRVYETTGSTAIFGPHVMCKGFQTDEFFEALDELYAAKEIKAIHAIAAIIDYSIEMETNRGIKLTPKEADALYMLYGVDTEFAISALFIDSETREWYLQRGQRLMEFQKLDA